MAMVLLQAGWRTPPDPLEMSLDRLTAGHRFDLTTWEIDAISGKLADLVRDPVRGLTAEQAQTEVREYLRLSNRAGELADEIERAYSDPTDPRSGSNNAQPARRAGRDSQPVGRGGQNR